MKPLYTIETKQDSDERFNRSKAVAIYKKLNEVRKPLADFVNTVKKGGLHLNVEEARGAVRFYKEQLRAQLNINRSYLVITRRVGRHESIEVTANVNGSLRKTLEEIKTRIKYIRRRRKDRSADSIGNRRVNCVLLQLVSRALNTYKKPTDMAEYVGIEIECVLPNEFDKLKLAPFSKWLNVGSDGSIHCEAGQVGIEFRVLVKRSEIREVMPPLMKALNDLGAKVNKSCGLHVHLDQRHAGNPGESFKKLVRSLNLLYTVVPKSRRENQYCHRNRRLDFDVAVHDDRYKAINATAFRRYQTLEIRLFGGTLSAEKIINWIEVLYAITVGTMPTRCPNTFNTACKHWNLSAENLTWLKARQEQFKAINLAAPMSESDTEGPDHDEDNVEEETCGECGSDEHSTSDHESVEANELAEAV